MLKQKRVTPPTRNPVSRDFMLMRTNVNLLNLVPEHDGPTFFVLQRMKCKPMHSEWEHFSDVFVLHRTKCKPMHFWMEAFYSAPSSYLVYVNISDFFKQTSSKAETNVLHRTSVTPTINVLHKNKWERESERRTERASEGVCADSTTHPLLVFVSKQ